MTTPEVKREDRELLAQMASSVSTGFVGQIPDIGMELVASKSVAMALALLSEIDAEIELAEEAARKARNDQLSRLT